MTDDDTPWADAEARNQRSDAHRREIEQLRDQLQATQLELDLATEDRDATYIEINNLKDTITDHLPATGDPDADDPADRVVLAGAKLSEYGDAFDAFDAWCRGAAEGCKTEGCDPHAATLLLEAVERLRKDLEQRGLLDGAG